MRLLRYCLVLRSIKQQLAYDIGMILHQRDGYCCTWVSVGTSSAILLRVSAIRNPYPRSTCLFARACFGDVACCVLPPSCLLLLWPLSVAAQDKSLVEIIVVDAGCKDNTMSAVASLKLDVKIRYPSCVQQYH